MDEFSGKPLTVIKVGTKDYLLCVSEIKHVNGLAIYNMYGPALNREEKEIFLTAYAKIRDKLTNADVNQTLQSSFYGIKNKLTKIAKDIGSNISEAEATKITYKLYEELIGFGPVEALYADKDINYIYCEGLGRPIIINHEDYGLINTNIKFKSKLKYGSMIWRLLERCKTKSEDRLNGMLEDGSFVESTHDLEFSIRKPSYNYGSEFLIKSGTITPGALAYLWMTLQKKNSILIVGPRGCGKTNLASGLLNLLPQNTKISIIEDKPNLSIENVNWSAHVSNLSSSSKMKLLYEESRHDPEYFVFDSLDEESANYVFQYISGTPGIVVFEEKNTDAAVHYVTNNPINIPKSALANFDVAITLTRDRKVEEILEILRYDSKTNDLVAKTVFELGTKNKLEPKESRFMRSLSEAEHEVLKQKTKEFLKLR